MKRNKLYVVHFSSNVSTTIDPIWDISLDLGPGLPSQSNGSNSSPGSGRLFSPNLLAII